MSRICTSERFLQHSEVVPQNGASGLFRHTKAADGTLLVSGKAVTGFSNTEEEAVGLTKIVPFLVENILKQNGGKYSKAADFKPHVISDGNLITGQNPPSSEGAAKAVLQRLGVLGR